MFSSNITSSGLVLGIIGCVSTPFAYSHFSNGGGIEQLITSKQFQQVVQQSTSESEKEAPRTTKNFDLLLVGTEAKDGVFTKLTLQQEGDKRTWSVKETNWLGSPWKNEWSLYHDDEKGAYILADKIWNWNTHCYSSALGWKNSVICLLRGKVTPNSRDTWDKKFLKIKLDGWKPIWTRAHGHAMSSMPIDLKGCNRTSVTEKGSNDLVLSIHCSNVTLQKTFKNPEIIGNNLSK